MLPQAIRRIQRVAQRPIQPVTIQQLLARSAAVSDADHLHHAAWIREEISVRLGHRLADFIRLPYVVTCNARFHEVFTLFNHAFETLIDSEPVGEGGQSVGEFAGTLRSLVRGHEGMVGMLQEGYGELQVLLDDLVDLDAFLNQTFFTRIGNRVLAEHFLAVHDARMEGPLAAERCTGVVHPHCRPAEIVKELTRSLGDLCCELYGVKPSVTVIGQIDTELSFVPEHLRFVLQEIMKNAFRATIERNMTQGAIPPVIVEIMKGSFDVTLKVSDRGGGMTRQKLAQVWRYGYTSAGDSSAATGGADADLAALCGQDTASSRQMAGYGFGLPLSRVYAQYFGGDITVQSMNGYGTDVYLNVNHLGDIGDGTRLVAS